MSGWGICALVVVILFLLGQIRLGVDGTYSEEGPQLKLRLGLIRLLVFPRTPKPCKPKKQKRSSASQAEKPAAETAKQPTSGAAQSAQPEQTAQKPVGGTMQLNTLLRLGRELAPLALEAVGSFWKKLVMDQLELSITVGSADPADAAMLYGQLNAAMGALWQSLNQALHVKNGRAHIGVDLQAERITVYAHAAFSIKLGQLLWLGLFFGARALIQLLRFQRGQKAKQQDRKAV